MIKKIKEILKNPNPWLLTIVSICILTPLTTIVIDIISKKRIFMTLITVVKKIVLFFLAIMNIQIKLYVILLVITGLVVIIYIISVFQKNAPPEARFLS